MNNTKSKLNAKLTANTLLKIAIETHCKERMDEDMAARVADLITNGNDQEFEKFLGQHIADTHDYLHTVDSLSKEPGYVRISKYTW